MMNVDELVARLKAGDKSGLAEYLNAVRKPLAAYVERNLGAQLRGKVEADDLVQEAIVSALQSHETIDFSKYEPFSWLCQLAERRLIDAHRRFFETQKRGQGEDVALEGGAADGGGGLIQLLIAGVTSPSKAFSRNQKEIALAESLNQLPEEQRKALIWRYVEGLDGKAIGERLGKSDGAVRIMIMRAMERLREILTTNDLFKNDSSLFDRGRN